MPMTAMRIGGPSYDSFFVSDAEKCNNSDIFVSNDSDRDRNPKYDDDVALDGLLEDEISAHKLIHELIIVFSQTNNKSVHRVSKDVSI